MLPDQHGRAPDTRANPPLPHGGRPGDAHRRFPDAPLPFIDLSTGINPVAYPVPDLPADVWTRLPEPSDLAALEAAAAAAYGVADPAMVVALPGIRTLIGLLPRLFPVSDVAVLGPGCADHAAAWRAAGASVRDVASVTDLARAGVAVLCNPDHPDGRRSDPAAVRALAGQVGLLVVDESYADFHPEVSITRFLPLPWTMVLRSFAEPYGLAGLRLGFVVAPPQVATTIRTVLGPWPVSGPAIALGRQALADTAWLARVGERLQADGRRLDGLLATAGMTVTGGTALFRLTGAVDAERTVDALGHAGILVQPLAGRLRFGLPAAGDWPRLEEAVAAIGAGQQPAA
jgi:cobalamin biosynthetic protein CobC